MPEQCWKCADCVFFCPTANKDGTCRRSQPAVVDIGAEAWPLVKADDWCGQFEYPQAVYDRMRL